MLNEVKSKVWVGFALLVSGVVLLITLSPFVSALSVPETTVYVTLCGDGVVEGVEQCDPGKRCANSITCSADLDCAGIEDGLCSVRAYGSCSATCTVIGGRRREPTEVTLAQVTVRPEQRNTSFGSNYDTDFYLSVLNSDNLNHSTLYQHPFSISANASGVATPLILLPSTIVAGVYDILVKSKAHLALIQNNAYLQVGENSVNFTNPDNGLTIGSVVLVAGDIDGAGNSQSTFGDNVINSVDLSILLLQIGSLDPSGNGSRSNLNQDSLVDQADLNIMLGNLDREGDK